MRTTRTTAQRIIFLFVFILPTAVAFAQTSIPLASPEVLPKLLYSRAEIERCVTLASPEALASALGELAQTKVVSEDEKAVLAEIVRGLSLILYPPPPPPGQAPKPAGEAFFVDPGLKNIQKTDSLLLTQLVQASQGKIFASGDGSAASSISQLLPALAIFRAKDPETARSAFEYAERFEATYKTPSVIPGLVKARYFLQTNEPDKAFGLYSSLLAEHPDLWPARLALGSLVLGRNDPPGAIRCLEPLVGVRRADPAFLTPYALSLYQGGRLADAEPFVLAALAADPASADLAAAEAQILLDRNEYVKAGPYLDIVGKKKPNDRTYLFLRSAQYSGLGRRDEALRWARKAFQAYPKDPEAMVLLAGVLYAGPEGGHAEASALAEAATAAFAAASQPQTLTPLAAALRTQAEREAAKIRLVDAYSHQDWYKAASLLDPRLADSLDKTIVATVLRKSGRTSEALDFASKWYAGSPNSEPAAEAFLRSLAASSGTALASAAKPGVSDSGSGLLSLAAAPSGQAELVGLVLRLLSSATSSSMQSFLYCLKGSLTTDPDAAIDSYRASLLARADNVEALAALAQIYAAKGDAQKALFYLKQARMLGVADKDLDAQLQILEKALGGK